MAHRLPLIAQSEMSECGLVCLAMICGFHGKNFGMAALRARFPISMRGTALNRIIEIAHELKFTCRPIRVELGYLPLLATPCILHWNLNHYVVLKKVRRDGIEIHDPATGYQFVPNAEVNHKFTGIALELTPAADFEALSAPPAVKISQLTGKIHGLGRIIGHTASLSIIVELVSLTAPLFVQWVVDQVLLSYDLTLLATLAIGFMLMAAFQGLVTYVRGYLLSGAIAKIGAQWSERTFVKMLKITTDFFEKRHVGDIVSRFASVQLILQVLSTGFFDVLLSGASSCVALAVLFIYSPILGFVSLLFVGGYSIIRLATVPMLRKTAGDQLNESAKQQSILLESIRGIRTIKLANRNAQRTLMFSQSTRGTAEAAAKLSRQGAAFSSASIVVQATQRIALIWISAALVISGGLTAGMLVAIVAYSEQFATRAAALVDKFVEMRLLRLHVDRVAEIALAPEEPVDTRAFAECPEAVSIDIQDAGFKYSESDSWVFRHCTFSIRSGECVAIVGPSGCGKTTLLKVLLGLLDLTEGNILVNGSTIQEFGLRRYREMLGAVLQDDCLFAGTILDNIAFFEVAPSRERVEEASRLASIHDEITAMPLAYNTTIGDMGSALSGGQRQRLLLARALFKKPKIMMLDEATSHLDVRRESIINAAVRNMSITRVIVAHRPDTIAGADRILELDAEHGTLDRTNEFRASRLNVQSSSPAVLQ